MKNWHSWFSLLNGRVAELPRGRAHARHPRTTFSSLFPMKNWHSWFSLLKWTRGRTAARARPRAPSPHCLLLSSPSSLHFQWTRGRIAARARPRAPSMHCLLLPPPYSLLFFLFGGKVRRDVYIRRPYTCVAGCTVRYHPSTIIEFVPVPNPMRAGFSRHVLDRLRRWLICHTARHGRD